MYLVAYSLILSLRVVFLIMVDSILVVSNGEMLRKEISIVYKALRSKGVFYG